MGQGKRSVQREEEIGVPECAEKKKKKTRLDSDDACANLDVGQVLEASEKKKKRRDRLAEEDACPKTADGGDTEDVERKKKRKNTSIQEGEVTESSAPSSGSFSN